MTIKSQGRTINMKAVGVPIRDARTTRINPIEDAARVAEENLQTELTIKAAKQAAEHEFLIDPITGVRKYPEAKSNFNFFGKEYNKAIRANYIDSLKGDIGKFLDKTADENYLSPSKFSGISNNYLQSLEDSVDGQFKLFVRQYGGQQFSARQAGIRGRFARLQIANSKANKENLISQGVEALVAQQEQLGSDSLGERVTSIVDNLVELPFGEDLYAGQRTRIAQRIHKSYAEIVYRKNLMALPLSQVDDAIVSFSAGKPFYFDGKEILPSYAGMKEGDRGEHVSSFNTILKDRRSYNSIRTREESENFAYTLARHKLRELREQFPGDLDLITGASSLEPSVILQYAGQLKTYLEANKNNQDLIEAATRLTPVLNKIAEEMGLDRDNFIPLDDPKDIVSNTNILKGLIVSTEKFNILKSKRQSSEAISEFADNQVQAAVEASAGIVGLDYDVKAAYDDLVSVIPKGASLEQQVRWRLDAAKRVTREFKNKIKEIRDNNEKADNLSALASGLAKINNMESRLDAVNTQLIRWDEEGKSAEVQARLLTAQFQVYRETDRLAAKNRAELFDISANFARQVPIALDQTAKNGEIADRAFTLSKYFQDQLALGVPEDEIFGDETAVRWIQQAGIIPQKTLDRIETLAHSEETIVDAANLYKRLAELPGSLSQLIDKGLGRYTSNQLKYLAQFGTDPSNIQHVLSDTFKKEPSAEGREEVGRIFGTTSSGKELTNSELTEKVDGLFAKVARQSTTQGGWWGKVVGAFRYNGFGRGMLGASTATAFMNDKESEKYNQETASHIGNVLGMSVNEGMPRVFKNAVRADFLNNGHALIKIPGNEDQMVSALQQSFLNVIRNGKWGISRFDPARARGTGQIFSISQKPLESFARVPPTAQDPTGTKYAYDALLDFVNRSRTRMTHIPGHEFDVDKETIMLDDIRLMPDSSKVNRYGVPLYHVYFSSNTTSNQLAFETTEDPVLGPETIRPMLFDLGHLRVLRMEQIKKQTAFKQKTDAITYAQALEMVKGKEHQALNAEITTSIEQAKFKYESFLRNSAKIKRYTDGPLAKSIKAGPYVEEKPVYRSVRE
tara:strand:- start:4009 stop:7245 length:3237 start_codon:yes stop_codon:yes gene_type:complete